MTISNMDGKIVTMKSMLFKGEEKVSIDTDLDGIPEKMMDQDFSNIMDFECY